MHHPDRALSETVSVAIICILMVAAAALLVASMTGVITNMLQKPALMSLRVDQFNTSSGDHIISIYNQQGDEVNLNGTSQTGGVSIVSLGIIDPAGSQSVIRNATLLTDDDWDPGSWLFIYQSGGGYVYSDTPPAFSVGSLPAGTYTVKVTDDKAKLLLHALPVTIR